ncbi:MAG: hypothetical protein COZ59_00150 [Bacteroidetes bacterium CG_4_8_14_3_um_filter_31_14]|nr:MAG: hypothetical protein COZ59_00150 [Bacteroidetes bacterium CG_4_8_14_3_um_filter_31_14]
MKTHQLTFVTLLLTFFLTGNIYGQSPQIDSLKIIPTNPTTNDTIKVVAYTTFFNSPCFLASSSFIIGTTINVYASHQNDSSMWPAFCNSIDTLTIGQLSAGTYVLHYHLADTVPPTTYDIDTIIFTVQQASGLQLIDNSEQEITVYPNPTTTEINVDFKTYTANRHDITFYSVLGQKVKTVKERKDITTIDISDLTDGIYFIVITSENNGRWTQKIIKNGT